MKLFEVIIKEDGIQIRREAEERMTGEQRYHIAMLAIAAGTILGFFALVTGVFR